MAAFAEETVVAAACVLPLPEGIPLTDAALLGCAVLTGYGAIHHSAQVREGETVAVFGIGGVGLSTVQSARIAGATTIVAVDVSRRRRSWPARPERRTTWSPPRTRPARSEPSPENRALTSPSSASAEPSPSAPPGNPPAGAAVRQSSVGGKDQQVTFNALELFHWGRTLSGCVYGNSDPAKDVPVLAEHVRAGRLDLGSLVTERIALDGIPGAFENMVAGKGGRALVVF